MKWKLLEEQNDSVDGQYFSLKIFAVQTATFAVKVEDTGMCAAFPASSSK